MTVQAAKTTIYYTYRAIYELIKPHNSLFSSLFLFLSDVLFPPPISVLSDVAVPWANRATAQVKVGLQLVTYPVGKKLGLISTPKSDGVDGNASSPSNAHGKEMEAFYASQVKQLLLSAC